MVQFYVLEAIKISPLCPKAVLSCIQGYLYFNICSVFQTCLISLHWCPQGSWLGYFLCLITTSGSGSSFSVLRGQSPSASLAPVLVSGRARRLERMPGPALLLMLQILVTGDIRHYSTGGWCGYLNKHRYCTVQHSSLLLCIGKLATNLDKDTTIDTVLSNFGFLTQQPGVKPGDVMCTRNTKQF